MNFDLKVKEDASLNYAKLSYELGNPYKSVAVVLQGFLKSYPKSSSYEEITGLLVTSYLYQQDYQGALDYLKKNKSSQNQNLSYEISYYRAIQLFNLNKPQEALPYFQSGKKSITTSIKATSLYWSAETNYRLGNFQESLDEFITFKKIASKEIKEYKFIDYNIGYSYFKLKEYSTAAILFEKFINTNNEDMKMNDDATIRMGDSFFATKEYIKSINAYKKVVDQFGASADYAQYQMAMSYGFLKNNDYKISQLENLLTNFELSNFRDDALFQLGNSYSAQKDNKNAHRVYKTLFKNFPRSSYISRALLRDGLLFYNDDENQKALKNYKEIVTKYPNSAEAKEAVTNAKNVYIDLGTVDEYAIWAKGISFINITDAEIDNTTYEAAENKFLANDILKAMEGFKKYIKAFPKGLHALQANFYLAQLLVKTNLQEDAVSNYQYVINQPQSEFSEEALNKLSQLLLEKEDWSNAIPLLERLEIEANVPLNIIYAQSQYGYLVRYDKASGEKVDIKPYPKKNEKAYRWNWDAPLIISPHNNKRLYFAANKLFRSDDQGNSWKAISGDLTRQIDRNTMPVMGKVWSMDEVAKNKSTTIYGNIVALSESPKQEDMVYVGTDDGLIQITSDAGVNWKKIESISGVPSKTYVNMVLASSHSENTVFAVFNNHKNGDFKPYVYRSRDKGASWTSITSNLPERGSAYCIAEDHINPNLLFVGTEFGVFVSVDGGGKWTQLKSGIPTVAIRDMEIQKRENDLVLGTFGRGFYVLDNYTPLREISEEGLENDVAKIYSIKDGEMYIEGAKLGRRGKTFQGEAYFTTPNPRIGAVFTYYIKEAPKSLKKIRQENEKELIKNNSAVPYPTFNEMRAEDNEEKPYLLFTISDNSGKVVRKIKTGYSSGIKRLVWDLRLESQSPVSLKSREPKSIYQGYDYGRMALPGQYTVSMNQVIRGKITELVRPVSFNLKFLEINKQIGFDRTSIELFAGEAAVLRNKLGKANKVTNDFTKRIKYMEAAIISTAAVDNKLLGDVISIQKYLQEISIKLYGDNSLTKREFETSPSINTRLGTVVYYLWRTTSAPTSTQMEQVEIAKNDLNFVMDELKSIKTQLKDLDRQLQANGASYTPGWMPKMEWE